METPKLARRGLTTADIVPLMGVVGSAVKGALDKLNKRMHGMHEETNMRMDGLVSRNDKQAQQLSAMAKQIAALERRLQPKG